MHRSGPCPVSPRQLLQHTSGLVDYSFATGFDQTKLLTAASAVASAVRTKLVAPPGAVAHYASTNYLYLGLLLEHVTGRPYGSLIADLTSSVGLGTTTLDQTAVPGRVGFSAAGIHSTVADLTAWGQALFLPGRVVTPAFVTALGRLDAHNVGLGLWPLCPCSTDLDGTKRAAAMGQYVGDGGMYTYPDGMTLVVHIQPPTANSEIALASLGEALRKRLPGA